MKVCLFLTLLLAGFVVKSQDIPLFSQKLTNSFIYNPAIAGLEYGSLTFSHRNNYSGVEGAPRNNFLSFNAPFANYRFGLGVNVFQEDVAAIKSTYFSTAFAYHISFNKFSTLSFGVSGEYNSMRLSDEFATYNDGTDLVLAKYANGVNQPDFSFGINYQHRLWKFGIAANRLNTAWFENDASKTLVSYYSGFIQGVIPIEGARSVLEPYFAFRQFSESSQVIDAGLYFTYDNKLITGLATRSGSILNGTLGYKINKNMMVGYSREIILGGVGGYTGSSNEFVLRIDYADRATKPNFRADYKNAMAYRKRGVANISKTNTYRTAAMRSPKQMKKYQKRLAPYSPNGRYQNNKKLGGGKKTPYKGKAVTGKRTKSKNAKISSQKRRQGGSAFRNNKYNPVKKKR
jgi:type IX secretion system PorP/SprF family membrane protein